MEGWQEFGSSPPYRSADLVLRIYRGETETNEVCSTKAIDENVCAGEISMDNVLAVNFILLNILIPEMKWN